jgi:RNA polymerase sigma-B factor
VQVPRKFNEINSAIGHLEESLSRQLGRAPTITELSESSGIAPNEILAAQQSWDACSHYESLESNDDGGEEDHRSLNEMVPDRKYQDFQLAEEDRELIAHAVHKLSDKTSKIVQFVFFYDLTQKETARILGLSEMVVSRAVNSGLKSLKNILDTEII